MYKAIAPLLLIGFYCSVLAQDILVDESVTMLALGDSYTIGESVSERERWPHQFIDELRVLGISADYPDYIAATGWTSKRLLQGIRTSLDTEKDYNLVSILIGVNNQYQRKDISTFEPDLIEIVDRVLEVTDQDTSRIFIISIPDYAYTPFGRAKPSISKEIDAYNSLKKRVASNYNIAFIDITPISRLGLDRPELVAGDGLHPSGLQYKEWVEQIMPRLDLPLSLSASDLSRSPDPSLSVYPNPAVSDIRISSTQELDRIYLFNAYGSLLRNIQVHSVPLEMKLSQLSPGSYVLWAIPSDSKKEVQQHKIILLPGRQ
jgi:lysophospholipase L1-like esterase